MGNSIASYDGNDIFGYAVRIKHVPNANIQQINAFFGIQGTQTIFGGSRGRVFMCSGLFAGPEPIDIRNNNEALMLSYADGQPRELVDNWGYGWANVIFKGELNLGELQFNPNGTGGVAVTYKAVFYGLT